MPPWRTLDCATGLSHALEAVPHGIPEWMYSGGLLFKDQLKYSGGWSLLSPKELPELWGRALHGPLRERENLPRSNYVIVKLAHNRFLRQKAADVKLGAARMSHVQPRRLIVTPDCDCIHDMAWPCDNPACNTGGIPVGNEGRVL